MKLLFMLLALISFSAFPAGVNGKFVLTDSDTALGVKFQINSDSESEVLGGATFVIIFDTSFLSFNPHPLEDHDYFFHNFSGGKYEKGTVTKVSADQIWINIELSADNEGTRISGLGNWTDAVTFYFTKKYNTENCGIAAGINSLYWSVFSGDNLTLLNPGEFTTESIIAGIERKNGIPDQFELCQNYPNPFNPSTKIVFRLKDGGYTKLILYDITGRRIETPVDEILGAGTYDVEIDGEGLTSGVYVYSLSVEGEYSAVKKMVLLK